jgi:threonine aldolase
MLDAAVGDDVFGEDPTVTRLEEYVAVLLGKEAALYCPSGMMTNQIGVHVATDRSDEVILHEDAHMRPISLTSRLGSQPFSPVSS